MTVSYDDKVDAVYLKLGDESLSRLLCKSVQTGIRPSNLIAR